MNNQRKQRALRGVLPVLNTPYADDGSVAYDDLSLQIDLVYEQGADGLVLAMVSELLRLSESERRGVAAHYCKHGRDKGVVIISVGAESTHVACEYARHAESVGADALMAIPPVATSADEDQIRRYYAAMIESVSIPMVVQDASGYVGKPMSIAVQAKLLDDFGDRVLFKPEATPIGPRLSALRDATGGRARVFEGTGGIALVDSYRRGIVGTMPGPDIVFALVALWQALKSGNDARIYKLSGAITSLIATMTSLDAFLAVEKHLLVKQGVFKNTTVRGPVAYELDRETREEVDRLFDQVRFAVEDSAA